MEGREILFIEWAVPEVLLKIAWRGNSVHEEMFCPYHAKMFLNNTWHITGEHPYATGCNACINNTTE